MKCPQILAIYFLGDISVNNRLFDFIFQNTNESSTIVLGNDFLV